MNDIIFNRSQVIDPSKNETPLVDAEAGNSDEEDEDDDDDDDNDKEESKEEGEGGAEGEAEAEAEEESEDSDEDDGEDDDDAMDEEESGIDKLRMQLHEVLRENGGDIAGTDTVFNFLSNFR